MEPLALVAGEGSLPRIVCETAQNRGVKVVAVAFSKQTAKSLEALADVKLLGVGETEKVVSYFKEKNCKKLCMIGKIEKKLIFQKIRIDSRAIKLLGNVIRKDDSSLMHAIMKELELEGFVIEKQTDWLPSIMPKPGILGKITPSKSLSDQIEYGIKVCRQLAQMEIGQTILIKDGVVLSVEAVEGTDKAIERGCQLGGEGAIMLKAGRVNQDLRFDIPTVGITTIKLLQKYKAVALAIEAGNVVIPDMEDVISACNKADVVFMAV
jgi:DUF1009 family protein